MKFRLPSAVTTRVAHKLLVVQKNSPGVLFGSGLVLMGATVVTACRGTLKLEAALEDIKADRADLAAGLERNPDRYSPSEVTKLNAYITGRGVYRIAKLYLPSLALGVAAVACLTKSHNTLTRRNAGLSAALAATERALEAYRGRVREEFGDDKEEHLWRGIHTEETVVTDDKGNPTKSKTKKLVGGGHSPYARVWGRDTTDEWDPQPSYNLPKLKSVQEWSTLQLDHKGHLFLNEVLDQLGLERSPEGAVCGWLSKKNGGADGYVDLGVMKNTEELAFLDFINGNEDHIVLDFNVDGEIWRKIG